MGGAVAHEQPIKIDDNRYDLGRFVATGDRKCACEMVAVWLDCHIILRENHIFNQFAKIFSLENFPLYGRSH